jgi:hypothetical protein
MVLFTPKRDIEMFTAGRTVLAVMVVFGELQTATAIAQVSDGNAIDPAVIRSAEERMAERQAQRERAATHASTQPIAHRSLTTEPSGRKTVVPPPPTLLQWITKIPVDARPNTKDGWDEFSRPKALSWLQNNAYGEPLQTSARIETVNITRVYAGDLNNTVRWDVFLEFAPDQANLFGIQHTLWFTGTPDEMDSGIDVDGINTTRHTLVMNNAMLGNMRQLSPEVTHDFIGVRFIGDERLAKAAKNWTAGTQVVFRATLGGIDITDVVDQNSGIHSASITASIFDSQLISAPGVIPAAK